VQEGYYKYLNDVNDNLYAFFKMHNIVKDRSYLKNERILEQERSSKLVKKSRTERQLGEEEKKKDEDINAKSIKA
jgi:hypothetical protein